VEIERKGEGNKMIDITRDEIKIPDVPYSGILENKIGYVKLNSFTQTAASDVKSAIEKMKADGMEKLILDLRGNGGGLLIEAVKIVNFFVPRNTVVVTTKGRVKEENRVYKTLEEPIAENMKLVVLIDDGSASASEIVAGSLQDLDRAVVIGQTSYGKGLVQRTYDLKYGSKVKITIAKYYTPSGRCIQKPYENGVDDYYDDLNKRYKHGEFTNRDSIQFADSLKFYTTGKRLVYGGGGIMPDIFIPLDTTENSKYLTDVYRKGIFNKFILKYVDQHRTELKNAYPDFKSFKAGFVTSDQLLNEFILAAETDEVKRDEESIKRSGAFIKRQLRALLANQIWGITEYYELINEQNPIIKEALVQMKSDNFKKLKLKF
jgi:carboxyl-terminal processing protease